jgi:N-acyl-D-aspartate/D-glutamate deacylase
VQVGASDAGAHVTQFCGTGDTTFFLEQYVKKDKSLPLEYAIQKLTGDLARQWAIHNRGTLEVGKAAGEVNGHMILIHMDIVQVHQLNQIYTAATDFCLALSALGS